MVLSTIIGLLLLSCKKEKDNASGEPDDPLLSQPVADQLKVYFDKSTVDFTRYDSGFVLLQRQGTGIQYLKRFVKGKQLLRIDIDDLIEGNYKLTMYVNLKLKNSDKIVWRQFRIQKDIVLSRAGIAIKGPDNELKKEWQSYIVISDAERSYHVTVPVDCADPYFEVLVSDPQWDYIYVERAAYRKTSADNKTLIDDMAFECDNGCVDGNGFIVDKETFKEWSANVAASQWNNAELGILLMNQETGRERQVWHYYDIPDLQ